MQVFAQYFFLFTFMMNALSGLHECFESREPVKPQGFKMAVVVIGVKLALFALYQKAGFFSTTFFGGGQ